MKTTEVIILCGGAGTRLASVLPGKQKSLAEVRGIPVLGLIINGLLTQGLMRIILATGVYGDQVRDYARQFDGAKGCAIVISEEPRPLGTGGAIRNAIAHVHSPHFLAINGDTFFKGIDFKDALKYHLAKNAGVTLIAVNSRAEADYGVMEIAMDGRAGFREKEGAGRLMSAGAYWMDRSVIASLAEGPFSVEKDLFPRLAVDGRLYGYRSAGEIHDIGTPERYRNANEGTHFS